MSFYYVLTNLLSSASSITPSGAAHALFGTDNLHDGIPGIPFKFNAAGADDTLTFDLGSEKSPTIASIHGHNFDSGMTGAVLRASTDNFSSSDVWKANFTTTSPTMYVYGAGWGSYRYWRIIFWGTNGNPISLGEVWLGASSSLSRIQRYEYDVSVIQPQIRQTTPSGQVYATNRTQDRQRVLKLEFFGQSESEKDEIEETILDGCNWGSDPIVVVPDSSDDIVIHGRVGDTWNYKRVPTAASGGGYVYGLTVTEDPFEEEYL